MKSKRFGLLIAGLLVVAVLTGCMSRPAPEGFSGIVGDGDSLYVGSSDGRIVALDATQRAANAAYPSPGEWEYGITTESRGSFGCSTSQVASTVYGTPVLTDGHLCVGTYEGQVFMLEAEARMANSAFPQVRSGEWKYPRDDEKLGPIVGSPAIVGDTVFVCSSISEKRRTYGIVYAIDRLYGDELWVSERLDGKLWVTPAVENGVVYISTYDGHIYALSADTGELQSWSYAADVGFVSSPLVRDGMVYAGSFDRTLQAVAVGSTTAQWSFVGGNWFWATPVLIGDILYAPCLDGSLYALSAASGNEVWAEPFVASGPLATTPVVMGDKLGLVTKDGDVYIVDVATGRGTRVANPDNEKATTCDATVVAPPAYHQGMMFVRTQKNVLWAIDPVARKVDYTFALDME